jgi:hypothetical protein
MAHSREDPQAEVHPPAQGRCQSPGREEPVVLSHPDYAGPAGPAGQQSGWQRRRGQGSAATGGHQGHPLHFGLGRVLTGSDEQPEHGASVPGRGTQQPLKPVPGTITTRGPPRPADTSATRPALVSTVAVVSGKPARARASEHHRRTAARPRELLYTSGTAPMCPTAPGPSNPPDPPATPRHHSPTGFAGLATYPAFLGQLDAAAGLPLPAAVTWPVTGLPGTVRG